MPHVVTCNALVSGFITSPVGAQLREWLPHPAPREQQPIIFINRGAAQRWLALTTQRSSLPPLWFPLRRSALNSTLFILRDLLSAVIIARHNESKMKFVANYFNNRFLSSPKFSTHQWIVHVVTNLAQSQGWINPLGLIWNWAACPFSWSVALHFKGCIFWIWTGPRSSNTHLCLKPIPWPIMRLQKQDFSRYCVLENFCVINTSNPLTKEKTRTICL